MNLIRRSPWTSQPQQFVPVDSPFNQWWLVYSSNSPFGISDGQGYDTYRPQLFGNTLNKQSLHSYTAARVPTIVSGKGGKALQFDGSNSCIYNFSKVGASGTSGDQTFLIVCEFDSAPSSAHLMGYASSGFAFTAYSRTLCVSGGTIYATGCNNSDGKVINSGITPTVGKVYTIAARFSSSGALYINGQKYGTGDLSETWTYMFSIGATGGLTDMSTMGGSPFPGKIYLAAAIDSAIPDATLAKFTANPWQIFTPLSKTLAFNVSGGGGTNGTGTGSISSISLSTITGTAQGDGVASVTCATLSITAPNGTASSGTNGNASGSVSSISLTTVSGTGSGSSVASGNISSISLSVISGIGSGSSVASGSCSTITLIAPTGAGSNAAIGSGSIASITISSVAGSAVGTISSTGTGTVTTITINAPTGVAFTGSALTATTKFTVKSKARLFSTESIRGNYVITKKRS